MFESQSYSSILQRMLDSVPDDVDKRPGSVIYDALAPAAMELASVYSSLDVILGNIFAKTADGEYLEAKVADFGLTRNVASSAVRKGMFYDSSGNPFDIPIGSRFSNGGLNYIVISRLTIGQFEISCETAGAVGNQSFGTLLPLDYIPGLSAASLADVLIPGDDEETDDELRARFLQQVSQPSTSGNKADYMKWALDVDGVGGSEVIPLWNGPGTVKVVIIDSSKQPASIQLIQNVQNYICPISQTGDGQAPVGANVTVAAATAVTINVTASIVLDGSRSLSQINSDFDAALVDYISSLAFAADPSVKSAKVGALLLNVQGVQDYSNLVLNGNPGNVMIGSGAVAVKGTVTLS